MFLQFWMGNHICKMLCDRYPKKYSSTLWRPASRPRSDSWRTSPLMIPLKHQTQPTMTIKTGTIWILNDAEAVHFVHCKVFYGKRPWNAQPCHPVSTLGFSLLCWPAVSTNCGFAVALAAAESLMWMPGWRCLWRQLAHNAAVPSNPSNRS